MRYCVFGGDGCICLTLIYQLLLCIKLLYYILVHADIEEAAFVA